MNAAAEDLISAGNALAAAGLATGSSGNLSIRIDQHVVITPTGRPLGGLTADALSVITIDGVHVDGPKPSKEFALHRAFYRRESQLQAVVHLHSRYAVAAACLPPSNPCSAIPAITPYFVMRVGQTPMLPYAPPGDVGQADELELLSTPCRAVLLQNHGSLVAGVSMASALEAARELEEAAALYVLLGERATLLSAGEASALAHTYGSIWQPAP